MAEFPTYEEMGKKIAEEALDGYIYKGKTLREWVDILAQTKWIPVSKRLPKLLEDVLLCDNSGDIQTGYHIQKRYADGREHFEWFTYENDDYGFEPKAWMPLPKPYKEG